MEYISDHNLRPTNNDVICSLVWWNILGNVLMSNNASCAYGEYICVQWDDITTCLYTHVREWASKLFAHHRIGFYMVGKLQYNAPTDRHGTHTHTHTHRGETHTVHKPINLTNYIFDLLCVICQCIPLGHHIYGDWLKSSDTQNEISKAWLVVVYEPLPVVTMWLVIRNSTSICLFHRQY